MQSLDEVWIGTHSGRKFYPFAPRIEDVDIADIAHSLARQCRFNGHCSAFYSVAEHSVNVSAVVPPPDALWGLLHDAAEAYISDIVRPIKPFLVIIGRSPPDPDIAEKLKFFRTVEAEILQVIGRRFGLPWPVPRSIDVADLRMLATERRWLFDDRQPPWGDIENVQPYSIQPQLLDPVQAEAKFVCRFRELTANG